MASPEEGELTFTRPVSFFGVHACRLSHAELSGRSADAPDLRGRQRCSQLFLGTLALRFHPSAASGRVQLALQVLLRIIGTLAWFGIQRRQGKYDCVPPDVVGPAIVEQLAGDV